MRILLILLITFLLFQCNSDNSLSFITDPDGSKQREESNLCKRSAVRLFLLSYSAGISQCDDPNSTARKSGLDIDKCRRSFTEMVLIATLIQYQIQCKEGGLGI